MSAFELDPGLLAAGFHLGALNGAEVLLMDNAAVPWLMLVPRTPTTELCDLSREQRDALLDNVDAVARFIRTHHDVHKINIATLGNVVRQMHVHVIGRRTDDYCWPAPTIGTQAPARYDESAATAWREQLVAEFGAAFVAAG